MKTSSAKRRAPGSAHRLTWEIDVPLLTNPLMLMMMVKAFVLAGFIMWALVSFMFAVQGEWDLIGEMVPFAAAMTGGVLVIGFLATALIFRNRMRFRFTLDDDAARCDRIDRRARVTDALAIGLGTLAGKPGAVGAGLLSSASSSVHVAWSSVARITTHPSIHAIALHNVWRTTAVIYSPADRWETVLATVRDHVERAAHPTRPNPIPRLLLRTALAIVACVPLFNLPAKIDLLAPLLVLCFALASIWLLPVLAWVIPGGLAFIGYAEAVAVTKPFRSYLTGEMIRPLDIFGGDDWAMTAMAAAGVTYLLWLTWSLLTGRIVSGLAGDLTEMGDD